MISIVKNMDCMAGMAAFADGFFDLVVADVPYGINVGRMAYTQEGRHYVKQRNGASIAVNKKTYIPKDWDMTTPGQEYFDEICRVSKHQIVFGIEYATWQGVGLGRIRWNKMVAAGLSFKPYELAYCSLIDYEYQIDLLWSGMMQAKSAASPTVVQGNKRLNERRIHPTQKPKMLYQILLSRFGKPGQKILDTHLGSGSSRIAAADMGMNFWGFEIDHDYFIAQEQRYMDEVECSLFK